MTAPAQMRAARPPAAARGRRRCLAMAVRAFRFWLVNYRRTWRGSIYSSVLSPVLYLGAMGLGLGSLVDARGTASLGGVSYLMFLAPGLMAASAMQTAVGESLYPVYLGRQMAADLSGRSLDAAAAAATSTAVTCCSRRCGWL